jgi:hypothetical protein
MATILGEKKEIGREIPKVVLQDSGSRALVVTVRGDGVMFLRAKGLKRQVMWKLDALYEKGIKEGRFV